MLPTKLGKASTVVLLLLIAVISSACLADSTSYPSNMPQAPLKEYVLSIPGDETNPVLLQVTVLTPEGTGPFPLAVLNHGANGDKVRPADQPRYRVSFAADYFLSRGYAVALPMMRGYAGSGGHILPISCDYSSTAIEAAKDIRAVIRYLVRQPYVDESKIVVGGQSFGGWNTLALGALNVPNVKGLVNFVGGIVSSGCPLQQSSLITAAGRLGLGTNVPSIWFYGENDKLFPTQTWRAMYQNYNSKGGLAELVDFGKFMTDSHQLLSFNEGLQIWVPKVDAFLGKVGLPNKIVYPQYMPIDIPPPTNYAPIDDVDSVPYLNDQGREIYRRFLSIRKFPRAIAIAPSGIASFYIAGFDPLAFALKDCSEKAPQCQLYAVDNDVVWKPTSTTSLINQSPIPSLNGQDGNVANVNKIIKFLNRQATCLTDFPVVDCTNFRWTEFWICIAAGFMCMWYVVKRVLYLRWKERERIRFQEQYDAVDHQAISERKWIDHSILPENIPEDEIKERIRQAAEAHRRGNGPVIR